MSQYNLTTLTENTPSTSVFTGNSMKMDNNPFRRSPLEDLFDEEERYEDDTFNERHFMSQRNFDEITEDHRLIYGI